MTEKGGEDGCAGGTLTPFSWPLASESRESSRPEMLSLEDKKEQTGPRRLDVSLKPVSLSFHPPHSAEVSF